MSKLVETLLNTGFCDWWNFAPQDNILVIKIAEVRKAKTETESGIVFAMAESKVTELPYCGEVVSKGPNATNIEVGNIVFYPPQAGFPLDNIRQLDDGSRFVMVPSDRVDAILVNDLRKTV